MPFEEVVMVMIYGIKQKKTWNMKTSEILTVRHYIQQI